MPKPSATIAAILVGSVCACAADTRPEARKRQDERVDAAVDKALKFIAAASKVDPNTGRRWWGTENAPNTAVTSVCIMAFLARGHVPGEGPYGKIIDEAVDFVVAAKQDNGLLCYVGGQSHGPMYEHGISTLMLAEVLGMTTGPRNDRVRAALGAAVNLILKAQQVNKPVGHFGGWRYQPGSGDADLSVSGWQVMALRAAANCGVEVPEKAIKLATDYVNRCAVPTGGFGYQPGHGAVPAMTGTGVLALEICSKHDTPQARRGVDYILGQSRDLRWGGYPYWFYTIYYVSQAVFQVKGPADNAAFDPKNEWEVFRSRLETLCLEAQSADGSWPAAGGGYDANVGAPFRSAMVVLALSVQYRFLPIYQR